MARIKVKDIPKDQKISREELKRVRGGAVFAKYDFFDPIQTTSVFPKLTTNLVYPNMRTTNLDPGSTDKTWK